MAVEHPDLVRGIILAADSPPPQGVPPDTTVIIDDAAHALLPEQPDWVAEAMLRV